MGLFRAVPVKYEQSGSELAGQSTKVRIQPDPDSILSLG